MLTEKQKFRLWKALDRRRRPHIARAERLITKALNRQLAIFLRGFDELNPSLVDDLLSSVPVEKAYLSIYMSVGVIFAQGTLREVSGLKADPGAGSLMEQIRRSNVEGKIQDFVQRNVAKRINGVKARGAKILKDEINKGVADNLTVDQTAANIRKRWRNIGKSRSKSIAQTEVTSASNYGAQLGAEASTDAPVKSWLSSRDARVRRGQFDHLIAENENVNIGITQPFQVSGELLAFPGDPSGSMGNVVGCRCGVLYVRQTPRQRPVIV